MITKNNLLEFAILRGALAVVMMASPFSRAQAQNEIEKVFGKDDLVIVAADGRNIPLRFQKMLNAFGAVQYENKNESGQTTETFYGCTATHLGQGYVITAGHCVGATAELIAQKNCSMISKNPLDPSTVILAAIDFGYRDQLVPFMKSSCQEITAAIKDDDRGLDFAILKVSPYPDEFILPDTSHHSFADDKITLFSHPMGEVLQWSKTCNAARVLHADIPSSFVQYQCDTKPGSSGAAIISSRTLKIVGVHDGGVNDLDESTGMPLKTGMNYGTYISNSVLYNELKKLGF